MFAVLAALDPAQALAVALIPATAVAVAVGGIVAALRS